MKLPLTTCRKGSSSKLPLYSGEQINSYTGPLPWLLFSSAARDQQHWSVPFLIQVHCLGCSSRPLIAINNTGLFRFLYRSTALVVLLCRCSRSTTLVYSVSYTGPLPWLFVSSAARHQQHWSVPFLIQFHCLGCSSRPLLAINNTGLFRFLYRSTALVVLLVRCSPSTTLVCSVSCCLDVSRSRGYSACFHPHKVTHPPRNAFVKWYLDTLWWTFWLIICTLINQS